MRICSVLYPAFILGFILRAIVSRPKTHKKYIDKGSIHFFYVDENVEFQKELT